MDDLIYDFLLQSHFPRAAILLDSNLLDFDGSGSNDGASPPAFVIVDPQTAQPLAIINTIDSADDEILRTVAIQTRNYAAKIAGKSIQGFVIRVDFRGVNQADQVQFYRIWPNKSLQQLTAKNFPDLETLRVARKLADAKSIQAAANKKHREIPAEELTLSNGSSKKASSPGMGLYIPALLILVLVLLDSIITATSGTPWLTLAQSVLLVGAALLLTIPAAIHYLRQ